MAATKDHRKRPQSPATCLGLLPVLKHKDATASRNVDTNAVLVLDPSKFDDTYGGVILGREELLNATWDTCGCHSGVHLPPHGNEDTFRNSHCQACNETLEWRYALSRRQLKITTNNRRKTMLQAGGNHAKVTVNDTTILDPPENNDNENWSSPPTPLQVGTVIEICPRAPVDDDPRCLTFQVVRVPLQGSDRNTQEQALVHETQPLHRSDSGKENGLSKSMSRTNSDTSSDTKPAPPPTSKPIATKKSDSRSNTKPAPPQLPSKSTSRTEADGVANTKPKPSSKLFFVPKGTDFGKRRREILADNLQQLGCTFVGNIMEADYIVVSRSVASLDRMAEACKVKRKVLEEHIRSRQIPLIVPRWADDCIAQKQLQLPPGRKYAWPHFSSMRRSRSNSSEGDEDGKQAKRAKSDPAVPATSNFHNSKKPFPKNVKCAEIFKQLSNLHKEMQLIDMDNWRSYNFRIVAGRLLRLDFEVDTDLPTMKRLRNIPSFGKGTLEKIEEILTTGTLERLRSFQEDPERVAMKTLTDIWGVGPSKAQTLKSLNYRSIEDVRAGLRENSGIRKLSLDRNQLVGVDCYEDILDRMPRSEVELIQAIVEKTAQSLHPGMEVTVQGSYRRGKETCGDVDIHLTHPSHVTEVPDTMLGEIVDALWVGGHIAFHLTVLNGMTRGLELEDYERSARSVPPAAWRNTKPAKRYFIQEDHKSFWMGCFVSPVKKSVRRRVDIKLYPYRERAFATVYFTGNGFMNRSMRLWAKRVFNWKLSDHGLFDIATGERILEATTEEEIFDHLKLVYKEPHERDSFDACESKDGVLDENMQLSEQELEEDSKNNVWVN